MINGIDNKWGGRKHCSNNKDGRNVSLILPERENRPKVLVDEKVQND